MNEIEIFRSEEFELRITPVGDSFTVEAPGLARALGFRDAAPLVETIPNEEKGYTTARTSGRDQRIWYLTEPGFYRAIGQRQTARVKDDAIRGMVERFQNWVYREVLPQVRRTGVHAVQQMTPAEFLVQQAQLLLSQERRVRQLGHEVAVVTARVDGLEQRKGWFAALGYAKREGLPTDQASLVRLGIAAARISRARGMEPVKIEHSVYGQINTYPEWALAEAAGGLA